MKSFFIALLILSMATSVPAQTPGAQSSVREAVQSFYSAFNTHGFDHAADFATEDWNHINPYGGRTNGRAAVLKELHEVHGTFLKHVSDTIEQMDIRFADDNVAVATVTSRMSTFSTPDGVTHENEVHIRTFVMVRRGGQWRVMQDQNTLVAPPPHAH